MSAEVSPSTGRPYGVERVCEAGACARSTYYARKARDEGGEHGGAEVGTAGEEQEPARGEAVKGACGGERSSRTLDGVEHDGTLLAEPVPTAAVPTPPPSMHRRGPKPTVSDEELLVAIREDLEQSPFKGEGHRKVWRRLRLRDEPILVARKRILRVMREAHLLSPHRKPTRPPVLHDGHIITDAPGIMWGTDGLRFETADDGWGWTFVAVEHWNAECVGVHVAKKGSRFAALEPVIEGLEKYYGGPREGAARGLALRMDHGSQYTSAHFVTQTRFWGIERSPGYVREPETNGVSERFIRTLKEQVFHGRVYRTIVDAREAVRAFVALYNEKWLIEKNGLMSPLELRRQREEKAATELAA